MRHFIPFHSRRAQKGRIKEPTTKQNLDNEFKIQSIKSAATKRSLHKERPQFISLKRLSLLKVKVE